MADEQASDPAALSSVSEWTELLDDESGFTYFYNSVTGESSWEPPAALAATAQSGAAAHGGVAEGGGDWEWGGGGEDYSGSRMARDLQFIEAHRGSCDYGGGGQGWAEPLGGDDEGLLQAPTPFITAGQLDDWWGSPCLDWPLPAPGDAGFVPQPRNRPGAPALAGSALAASTAVAADAEQVVTPAQAGASEIGEDAGRAHDAAFAHHSAALSVAEGSSTSSWDNHRTDAAAELRTGGGHGADATEAAAPSDRAEASSRAAAAAAAVSTPEATATAASSAIFSAHSIAHRDRHAQMQRELHQLFAAAQSPRKAQCA